MIDAPAKEARMDSSIDDDGLKLCEGSVEVHFIGHRRNLRIRLNQSLPCSSVFFSRAPSNMKTSRQINSSFANLRGSRQPQVKFSSHQRVWGVVSTSYSYLTQSCPCCSKNLFVHAAQSVSD